jgi:anti-anti-sigma factor
VSMLKIDIQSAPPMATLICSGRLVLGVEAETLRCVATSRPEKHLLLDLSRLHAIDAAGLGLLVELHCWAQEHSARLTIAHPPAQAKRLMSLTGLDRVLDLSDLPAESAAADSSAEWHTMTA